MSRAVPFADLLADSGLLTPDQRAEVARLRTTLPTTVGLARELVRRAWLTPLQARWLARGRRPVVGRYALLDRLGKGGMGRVFLARHLSMRRTAAVKFARAGGQGEDHSRRRFLKEVRAIARLDHPNVVHAYDAGSRWGLYWLAMEYVSGPDLGRLVTASGLLAPGVACGYARQALLGLQHLHQRGVVHRDVKPTNLALAGGGLVKVLDIGLARVDEPEAAGLTQAGVLLGSADYAAPEQIREPSRAGPAADLYGLGCTLYFLLTGRVPFPGGTPVEKAVRQLSDVPQPVEDSRPDIPPALAGVVRRLMAKRPQDRYPSAAVAAAALAVVPVPAGRPALADETRPTAALGRSTEDGSAGGETVVGLPLAPDAEASTRSAETL